MAGGGKRERGTRRSGARVEPLLDDALRSLGRADQECALLHYFQGWTLREIGAARGVSEDAVRMRVSRVVEKMRRFVRPKGAAVSAEGMADLMVGYGADGRYDDACYKPFVLFDGNQWLLWYNGRHDTIEQIGLVTNVDADLGFPR